MTAAAIFESDALLAALEDRELESMDELDFGLVVMDRHGTVTWCNATEAANTGFEPTEVIGKSFFESVGPCMNNFLVAQRYADSEELDESIDYVFTVAMRPTPVRLRLLARAGSDRQYLAVRFP